MPHLLDSKLSDGRVVADVLFKPLTEQGVDLTVVDVGARNAMHQNVIPSSYAINSKIIGFEPNQEEYEKLIEHTTDAEKIGALISRFKQEIYFNCALWNRAEQRQFYVTAGVGASTLMGYPDELICRNMILDNAVSSYYDLHTRVVKQASVDCKRLDSLVPGSEIIDIIKIDVEGGELAVMEGAQSIFDLENILLVKTEFFLTPYFHDSPLLGHQHVFLHNQGLRLIGFDWDHARYTREKTSIPQSVDRRPMYAGDAYFILDPDRKAISKLKMHRLGLACLVFNFASLGISLIKNSGYISNHDMHLVELAISKNWSRERLKYIWARIPQKIKNIFI